MTDDRLISTSELCERYGRSTRTLHRWQQNGDFPRPVIQGGHGAESRWRESDIKAWEDRRQAA
ncbi:helix-turn-helix domain-containing protein [uncultured Halomonas sp.]|uniref:helix-turn-helix transcriptional regulator n=1 Tax=uncultured Halomonas sp. TaxID=173971 RepID=UPI002621BE48|nr:helix-turn-helix domain-containing protein [uncultured Halomonas sp.]